MIKKYVFLTLFLVLSVVVLSACGKKETPGAVVQERAEEAVSDQESLKGSIKDLLGLGKNVECKWSAEDEGMEMSGVAWVSGKKTRTEMKVSTPDGEMESYFLSDGETAYSWGSMGPGFKFKLSDFEQEAEEADFEEGEGQFKDFNKEYEYKCKPWTVDQSKFVVPTGIEFADMGEQLKQMEKQAEEMGESLKGLCNSLPEAQRAECLKGLETE